MSIIKSFSVGEGDMFYINHNTSNLTIIDCNLKDDRKEEIMNEICEIGKGKDIVRFISTHPDEDHFHGIEYFDERFKIVNFYCVENKAIKEDDSKSFDKYCGLRDGEYHFYISRGCQRRWMNQEGEDNNKKYIGSSRISILWPILSNDKFKEELEKANKGESYNNISPIIKYSLENGVTVLWFGDLEHEFMESIVDVIELPEADIIFAPHHGRFSGAVPEKWLKQINPKVIISGEAPSKDLKYFQNYHQITQNSAKDITLVCGDKKVDFYSSNEEYSVKFLSYEGNEDDNYGYYFGTLNL